MALPVPTQAIGVVDIGIIGESGEPCVSFVFTYSVPTKL